MELQAKANILLVDDRPENLLALEAVLGDLGQNLVKTHSGKEALKYLLENECALTLLDVHMPDMDGFETAMLIRSREKTRHVPIIFLTAVGTSEMQTFQGYAVGAVDYILKPFIPQILKAKVKVFVDLFQATYQIKQQAEEIQAVNAKLQQEIQERKAAEAAIYNLNLVLEKKNGALEALNKELNLFSHSVSHDLRAPLRAIQGFSQALLEDYAAKLDQAGQDYLNRIGTAVKRMDSLIHDLLTLSRISGTEMHKEAVDLSSIARIVTADLQKMSPARRVEVIIMPDIVVQGDEKLLHIAMENLLNNAWKFTAKTPQAKIEVGITQIEGKAACFVRDNGAGFDMAYAQRLFGAFQRLHTADEFEGTGIGLATVQRIIHRHGGRIWAHGEVDKGAIFYFSLP